MISLIRKYEYEEFSKLKLNGNILDLGGSRKSGYHQLIKGNHSFTVVNIDKNYGFDLNFNIEKKFPLPNDAYDNILAINLFEHIYDYNNLLNESHRVLKSSGNLVLTSPFLFPIHGCPQDYNRFTESALVRIFKEHGFKIERITLMGNGIFSVIYQLSLGIIPWAPLQFAIQSLCANLDNLLNKLSRRYFNMGKNIPLGYFIILKKCGLSEKNSSLHNKKSLPNFPTEQQMQELDSKQQIQEDEYIFPYHYTIKTKSRIGRFYFSYVNYLKEILDNTTNSKILDTGCGDGYFINKIQYLKNNGNKIFGSDYSEKALAAAKLFNPEDTFICSDISDIEYFEPRSIDYITNICVFEHIPPEKHDLTLKEIHRILGDEGRFILVIPTHKLFMLKKHFMHFSKEEIARILRRNGFVIEKCQYLHHYLFDKFQTLLFNRFWNINFLEGIADTIFFRYFQKCGKGGQLMALTCVKNKKNELPS